RGFRWIGFRRLSRGPSGELSGPPGFDRVGQRQYWRCGGGGRPDAGRSQPGGTGRLRDCVAVRALTTEIGDDRSDGPADEAMSHFLPSPARRERRKNRESTYADPESAMNTWKGTSRWQPQNLTSNNSSCSGGSSSAWAWQARS